MKLKNLIIMVESDEACEGLTETLYDLDYHIERQGGFIIMTKRSWIARKWKNYAFNRSIRRIFKKFDKIKESMKHSKEHTGLQDPFISPKQNKSIASDTTGAEWE